MTGNAGKEKTEEQVVSSCFNFTIIVHCYTSLNHLMKKKIIELPQKDRP